MPLRDSQAEFFPRIDFCVMVCAWAAGKISGDRPHLYLGLGGNVTTRDRQLGHALSKILCFEAPFPLTDFSHLFTLRRQIRRTVIRRADKPSPWECRKVV